MDNKESSPEEQKVEKLEEFKAYVHGRLDKMGVPSDPEPENNAKHGCRIEGRLNFLEQRLKAKLTPSEPVRSAEEILYDCTGMLPVNHPSIMKAMEEYASQFKEGKGEQRFTIEDTRDAFDAGMSRQWAADYGTVKQYNDTSFDEWIKTRK